MSDAQGAQRDDSPMDVDQPSPLDQDPAPLGRPHLHTEQHLNLPVLVATQEGTYFMYIFTPSQLKYLK